MNQKKTKNTLSKNKMKAKNKVKTKSKKTVAPKKQNTKDSSEISKQIFQKIKDNIFKKKNNEIKKKQIKKDDQYQQRKDEKEWPKEKIELKEKAQIKGKVGPKELKPSIKAPLGKNAEVPQIKSKKDLSLGISFYVSNLNYERTEPGILALFSKYGEVKHIRLIKEGKENKSKGVAFVLMEEKINIKKILEELNGKIVDDRSLKVALATQQPKDLVDPSLGNKFRKLSLKKNPFHLKQQIKQDDQTSSSSSFNPFPLNNAIKKKPK